MTRRMIDSSMWNNEHFADLPFGARLLQIGMINHADDQGRIKANPAWLRAQVFPYDDVSSNQVGEWIHQIERNGTIILYEVDGKQYAQLSKWWDYQSLQYASPSEYPPPPGWQDRIRRTVTKGFIGTFNWTLTNGEVLPDTCDAQGKPLPRGRTPKDSGNYSPERSPDYSGESTPERSPDSTIELNLIEDQHHPPYPLNGHEKQAMAAVFACYADNMPDAKSSDGKWKPIIRQSLNELIQTYGNDAVIRAINETVTTGGKSIKYLRKVLENHTNGVGPPGKHDPTNGASWAALNQTLPDYERDSDD